jgi:hypothetical protein
MQVSHQKRVPRRLLSHVISTFELTRIFVLAASEKALQIVFESLTSSGPGVLYTIQNTKRITAETNIENIRAHFHIITIAYNRLWGSGASDARMFVDTPARNQDGHNILGPGFNQLLVAQDVKGFIPLQTVLLG